MNGLTKGVGVCLAFLMLVWSPSVAFGAKRALLIGINDYKHLPPPGTGRYTDLDGPVNDVNLLRETLISTYGFSNKEIKTVIDAQATREGIKRAFDEWLVQGTTRGDLAVLFYSGHGVQHRCREAQLPLYPERR